MFANAVKLHQEHPETFHLDIDYEAIVPGAFVKVCDLTADPPERFWVKVTQIDNTTITGLVWNMLVFSNLKHGDEVTFTYNNVYDLYTG